jgi:YMGG-like Gly-zipper
MVKHAVAIMTLCFAPPLLAQTSPGSGPSPAPPAAQKTQAASSPAKSIGLFAYPKNQQSADQQLKDENDCFASAKQQTGIDPLAPLPATKTEEQKKAEQQAAADNAKQARGGRVRGAARGAAGGAAVGAIADDEAGKGAAAGATAGAVVGGAKQRQANKAAKQQAAQATAQQQQQEEAQAQATHQQGIDTLKRAFSACMDARGYSIK